MATPAAAPRPSVPTPRRSRFAVARARHRSLLRRPTDRWRSVVVDLELLVAVVAAVLCAVLGVSVYGQAHAQALRQAARLHPVQATVLAAPYPTGIGGATAKVSWTAPDGTAHKGTAVVPAADRAGDRTQIWLDASGTPTSAPSSQWDAVGTAVLTGLFALLGAWGVVVGMGAFASSRLNRRDERAWEAEWEAYEPLWSRRK